MSDKKPKQEKQTLEETIQVLINNVNYLRTLLSSLAQGFTEYINWKGDEANFKKHLENLKKDDKLKENDEKTKKTKV